MKSVLKYTAGVLAFVLLITGAYFLYNRLSRDYSADRLAGNAGGKAGQQSEANPAPDFTVVDNDMNKVRLSDMRGKPVVFNFWASWCPPCKEEMPDFEEMYKKYGDKVTFMMVNMTDGERETIEKARAHIQENGYTFPVYFDNELSAAAAYSVVSLPTTYFADADGNLVTYANGMIDAGLLETGIEMINKTDE